MEVGFKGGFDGNNKTEIPADVEACNEDIFFTDGKALFFLFLHPVTLDSVHAANETNAINLTTVSLIRHSLFVYLLCGTSFHVNKTMLKKQLLHRVSRESLSNVYMAH